MAEPKIVADCIKAMKAAVDIPVTVKTRLGIDEHDSDDFLYAFTDACVEAGADQLTFMLGKLGFNGLSPKENREIPELQYDRVYKAQERYKELPIAINGGIKTSRSS